MWPPDSWRLRVVDWANRERLASVADLCYERATSKEFDWDTVAKQFDEEFQEVLTAPLATPVEVVEEQETIDTCSLAPGI